MKTHNLVKNAKTLIISDYQKDLIKKIKELNSVTLEVLFTHQAFDIDTLIWDLKDLSKMGIINFDGLNISIK